MGASAILSLRAKGTGNTPEQPPFRESHKEQSICQALERAVIFQGYLKRQVLVAISNLAEVSLRWIIQAPDPDLSYQTPGLGINLSGLYHQSQGQALFPCLGKWKVLLVDLGSHVHLLINLKLIQMVYMMRRRPLEKDQK